MTQTRSLFGTFLLNPLVAGVVAVSCATSAVAQRELPEGTTACAVDLISGEVLVEHGADPGLKPASIQKLLTAATALSELGPDFRFSTDIYASGRLEGSVQQLIVRGGGDPTFTSESVFNLIRELRRSGVKSIRRLTLDNTAFVEDRERGGARAYLAGNSALSFNFNTVAITACPVTGAERAALSIEPPDAGFILEGAVKVGKGAGGVAVEELSAGKRYRVSGAISRAGGCTTVYRSVAAPERMLGAVVLHALHDAGIAAPKEFDFNPTPAAAERLFSLRSEPLSVIVSGMNHFSTNFTAEQIAYAIGRSRNGERMSFDHERGLSLIAQYVRPFLPPNAELRVRDASGLSHENRAPVGMFCALLRDSYHRISFAPEFVSSLAVSERSGTLREREFPGAFVRGKTGTLDGVSSLAGYLWRANGASPVAFAIVQNRSVSKDQMLQFERQFVSSLSKR